MTDYVLPETLYPNEVSWRLVDLSTAFANPLSGAQRTYSRGQRWSCRMRWRDMRLDDRSQLLGLIAAMRGKSNRIWLTDTTSPIRGSFPCPELISDPYTRTAAAHWTSNNAEMQLRADLVNGLRLFRTGVVDARFAYTTSFLTVVSGAYYAYRYLIAAGRGTIGLNARLGTTQAGNELLFGTLRSAAGYYVENAAASGTVMSASFGDFQSGRSAGDFQFLPLVSLSRCARVNGTVAAGASAILLKNMPVSTNGLALAGDMFEVNGELKRLIANLDSDASGNAHAMFEPALRAAATDNVSVVFRSPFGRFVMEDAAEWPTRISYYSDFELSFLEA